MNFKNPILTSLILPLLAAFVLSVIKLQNDSEVIWTEYGILLLFMFVLWAITAFIGAFISYLTERKKHQIIVTVTLQAVLIAAFSYYVFFMNQPSTIDKDQNMKMNRLMVDYDKRLDDSLTSFPNSIRIAYSKLESKFPNPNDFELTYFGSERDSLPDTRSVYFSYKVHDTVELYSKIQVLKDTAYVVTFNKSIDDTEFLNSKRRLKLLRLEEMRYLLEETKNGENAQ